jgi:translation initiation factor RLI1
LLKASSLSISLCRFIPTENLRFRDQELTFKISENPEELLSGADIHAHKYPQVRSALIFTPSFTFSLPVASSCPCRNRVF